MSFDSILDAIETKTDREINLFNSRFESVLANIETLVIANAVEAIKDPLQFDFVFQGILQESGYYKLVNSFIDDAYDKNYQDILAIFKEGGIDIVFSEDDLLRITELKKLDIETFANVGSQAANNLKKDIYKYSLSNLSTTELTNNIRQSLADTGLAKYSKTYAETSISNYNQAIINLKSEDAAGVWIYVGVSDKKTRDFCQDILEDKKYYNDSQKSKIENDKQRKWNCRHQLLLVSEDYAIKRGYKSA